MPIKIGKRKFKTFREAVTYIKRTKKFSDERARRYVASIYEKQKEKNKRKKRRRT